MSDTRRWRAVYDAIIKAGGAHVRVGVMEGVNEATSEIAEIATIHEYGAPAANIPERSYIRSTGRERKAELQSLMARIVRAMIARQMTEERGLQLVGAWMQNAIKARIISGPFEPLKPRTIARRAGKGPHKPLIDTGQMINSVGWIIVE